MSVQGGGGGKKIPTGTATPPKAAAKPPSTPPRTVEVKKEPDTAAVKAETVRSDQFEHHSGATAQKPAAEVRLEEAFSRAASHSGVENLVRLLESSRAQLLSEQTRLRLQVAQKLKALLGGGYSDAELTAMRAELFDLRRKMSALRKRRQHLLRRLKSTFAHAGKTQDANLQKQLGAQLHSMQQLGPGMAHAMSVLSAVEHAYTNFSDGSPAVFRARVQGGDAAVADAFAATTPGAAVAASLHELLLLGPDGDGSGALASDPPAADEHADVTSLAALARALRAKGSAT